MRINWSLTGFEGFVRALPKVITLYFGSGLKADRIDSGYEFHYGDGGLFHVEYTYGPISDQIFSNFTKTTLTSGASAGLIATWQNSPFRVRLLPSGAGCWIPIVSWGRKQMAAIAELNWDMLHELLQYSRHSPKEGSQDYGSGVAMWSDIVRFMSGGIQIGERLGVNPEDVKTAVLVDVHECFQSASGNKFVYWDKVGPDGWYHFMTSSDVASFVDLASRIQTSLSQLPSQSSYYDNSIFRVVMAINAIQSCRITRGGPFDKDSGLAYELTRKHYDHVLRATESAHSRLAPQNAKDWTKIDNFAYLGTTCDVYGHAEYLGVNLP